MDALFDAFGPTTTRVRIKGQPATESKVATVPDHVTIFLNGVQVTGEVLINIGDIVEAEFDANASFKTE